MLARPVGREVTMSVYFYFLSGSHFEGKLDSALRVAMNVLFCSVRPAIVSMHALGHFPCHVHR